MALEILLDGFLTRLPESSKVESVRERVGVIHVHTVASDGSGTVAQVMEAAEQANLSFIAITDHNTAMTTDDLAEDPPDLPIISGAELSTSAGHFLALGLPPSWPHPKTKDDRQLLAAAKAVGAFRILAHPFHPQTPWTDWQTSDFDGMEIWNEDAAWRQNNFFEVMNSLLLYSVNEQLALVRLAHTPDENFAKWDELLMQRPVVGICAADTHARIRLGFGNDLHFPGYVPSFKVAHEHVLLDSEKSLNESGQASGDQILNALRHGHTFCALDSLYPANGFSFQVVGRSGPAGPGDTLRLSGDERVRVFVPTGASLPLIKIFRDGKPFAEKEAWTLDLPMDAPGRYRAEVFLRQPGVTGLRRWTLWTFTNPVYVTP